MIEYEIRKIFRNKLEPIEGLFILGKCLQNQSVLIWQKIKTWALILITSLKCQNLQNTAKLLENCIQIPSVSNHFVLVLVMFDK